MKTIRTNRAEAKPRGKHPISGHHLVDMRQQQDPIFPFLAISFVAQRPLGPSYINKEKHVCHLWIETMKTVKLTDAEIKTVSDVLDNYEMDHEHSATMHRSID